MQMTSQFRSTFFNYRMWALVGWIGGFRWCGFGQPTSNDGTRNRHLDRWCRISNLFWNLVFLGHG